MRPARKIINLQFAVIVVAIVGLSGNVYALTAKSEVSINAPIIEEQSYSSNISSVLIPIRQAQAQPQKNNSGLRSKNEVMQEVKSRYNGQVVKISLNDRTQMYSVRVLLPNGKVKNLSVSAKK